MKRNLLFLLMTLVLPIGACAYDAYINGIYYNFSENEAEVTSSNNPGSYSGSLVIPEFVGKDEKTYRVTSIGEDAFLDCRTLTSIAIPNYLTHIGSGAFWNCKSLTEVHIKDMEAWCKITFGESHSNPLYYAKHLYMNGQEIKDLTIPDSIATINNYAFYNCSDLKTITLPGSITSIGHDAFYGCSSLTDVYCDANEVPEAVSSAFPYASLKSATLHVPAGSIDKYKAQSPWSRFGNIVGIPQEEYFPEGTKWTEIRLDTLKYDSWYSKVDGEWVPNFETIEYCVEGTYPYFSETFGDNSLKCVYTNCSEWTDSLSLLIVEGKINEYLNYGRRVMATVPIYFDSWDVPSPAMAYNFDWRVGMPISFIDILSTTYDHNSETAVFGIIEEINEGNFGGVRPLSYTDVNGVRFIQGIGVTTWNDGECIFGPVKPYEALSAYGAIEPEERHYRSMLVHFERNGEVLYDVWPRKGSTVEVTIDGLNYFLYLDRHEAVLTSRNNCSGEVDIPSEVSYNDETFVVKSMTHTAFHNNSELTKVRIPKTIEEIIHYYPVDPDWLDPPTGMANPIYVNPFKGCTALESIEVDEENPCLKSIDGVLFSQDGVGQYYYKTGSYSGTGLYCYPEGARQESYTIPESVEWIGGAAFPNNQYLTTLTIPNSMKHICYDAFSGCCNLTDVYCYAENAPIAWDGAFRNVPIASATLHVPAGSIEEYRTTSPWSGFGNIVALQEEPHQPQSFLEGNPIWVYKYEHIPTPRTDDWMKYWFDTGDRTFTYYFLGGQEEIGGKVYTMLGKINSNDENELNVNHWYPIREDGGIVYTITDSLPGVVLYYYYEDYPIPYLQQGNECILYNFSAEIGDKLDKNNVVKSLDTYQLMDGTECRVLKTGTHYDLYEKLGYKDDDGTFSIIDPLLSMPIATNGHAYVNYLNAFYQDNNMLYKAPDAREGLCVNDTITTLDDAYEYARSYKADPRQEEVFAYIRQLQKEKEPVSFTAGQIATIILPTNPDASKGKYYRLDRYEDGQIIFEQELQPQAHIPYIIVPNEDFSIDLRTLDLTGLSRDTVSIAGISFIGSYVSETFDYPDGFYIDFIDITPDCRFDEFCVIGALRAYLLVHWDDPYNQGGTRVPPLNKREIVLRDDETGIKSLNVSVNHNDKIFNLAGQRLSKPQKGIYIENGKIKAKTK